MSTYFDYFILRAKTITVVDTGIVKWAIETALKERYEEQNGPIRDSIEKFRHNNVPIGEIVVASVGAKEQDEFCEKLIDNGATTYKV